jgi:hypothetical protein
MAKLVKFEDGTFGIKKGFWFFSEFLGRQSYKNEKAFWWNMPRHIIQDCKFETAEEAVRQYKLSIAKDFIEYEVVDKV